MIETARLQLIPCQIVHFTAILKKDTPQLEELLQAHVPEDWTEFHEAFAAASRTLSRDADLSNWWIYLIIFKPEQVLAGSCGFKGKPDQKGVVEIGYEVSVAYRNRGIASELAKGLTDFAFSHEKVKKIIAHTLSENNTSARILKRTGFMYDNSFYDADEGWLWQWKIEKEQYFNQQL
jgi:RimJ/RimL family protein N-acetyltransferase